MIKKKMRLSPIRRIVVFLLGVYCVSCILLCFLPSERVEQLRDVTFNVVAQLSKKLNPSGNAAHDHDLTEPRNRVDDQPSQAERLVKPRKTVQRLSERRAVREGIIRRQSVLGGLAWLIEEVERYSILSSGWDFVVPQTEYSTFLLVKGRVTNMGRTPTHLRYTPSLIDGQGNIYAESDLARSPLNTNTGKIVVSFNRGTMNPRVPSPFRALFEVPTSARRVKMQIGPDGSGDILWIDLSVPAVSSLNTKERRGFGHFSTSTP